MKKKILALFGVLALMLTFGVTGATAVTTDCRVWSGGGWLGGACPEAPGIPDATVTVPLDRIAGPTAVDTAAAISATHFAPGVEVVYIANKNGIDAVAGGAAADGPILTVPALGVLPASTATELARLNPARVVILGGHLAVSDNMAAQALAATNE